MHFEVERVRSLHHLHGPSETVSHLAAVASRTQMICQLLAEMSPIDSDQSQPALAR